MFALVYLLVAIFNLSAILLKKVFLFALFDKGFTDAILGVVVNGFVDLILPEYIVLISLIIVSLFVLSKS